MEDEDDDEMEKFNLMKAMLADEDKKMKLVKSLCESLGCDICLGTLCRPLTLHCGHTFCAPCIQTWVRSHNTCPTCRTPTLSYRTYKESVTLREILGLLCLKTESPPPMAMVPSSSPTPTRTLAQMRASRINLHRELRSLRHFRNQIQNENHPHGLLMPSLHQRRALTRRVLHDVVNNREALQTEEPSPSRRIEFFQRHAQTRRLLNDIVQSQVNSRRQSRQNRRGRALNNVERHSQRSSNTPGHRRSRSGSNRQNRQNRQLLSTLFGELRTAARVRRFGVRHPYQRDIRDAMRRSLVRRRHSVE